MMMTTLHLRSILKFKNQSRFLFTPLYSVLQDVLPILVCKNVLSTWLYHSTYLSIYCILYSNVLLEKYNQCSRSSFCVHLHFHAFSLILKYSNYFS
jgi:hypothetical protein